jgi:hypothetical protein
MTKEMMGQRKGNSMLKKMSLVVVTMALVLGGCQKSAEKPAEKSAVKSAQKSAEKSAQKSATPPPFDNFGGKHPVVYHDPYQYGVQSSTGDYVMQTSPEHVVTEHEEK